MAFVDYEKAFDSLETWAVLESPQRCRIDWRFIEMLRCLCNVATVTVQVPDQRTRPIQLRRGVRQGDVISSKSFTNAMEDVFKTLDWTARGVSVNGERISHLRFADDIVIFAETLEELSGMLNDLDGSSRRVGLGMNLYKTKVMFSMSCRERYLSTASSIEVVSDYVYWAGTNCEGGSYEDSVGQGSIWQASSGLYVIMLEVQSLRALRPTEDNKWCRDVDTDGGASPQI